MRYQGKYCIDGNTVKAVELHNHENEAIKRVNANKRNRIRNKKKKLLIAAGKTLVRRILLAIGLLLAYACMFGIAMGTMIMMIRPEDPWGYIIVGVCIGYAMLVCNCRAFEYIGDKIGYKY